MTGKQTPRIRIEPKYADTEAEGASKLMQAYGCTLDEWQELILSAWLSVDKSGEYCVTSGGLSVPRQNGKTEILIALCFYHLVVNGARILFTAHQARSSKKVFRRLSTMFSDKRHPEIVKQVSKIRQAIGEEAIELVNGGIIEFTSRSRQVARGYDGISIVIFDEAQELTDDQLEALMATLSASTTGNRQMLYCGTPPYPGCVGEVFKRFRDACIMADGRGENTRSSWHEWSVPGDTIQDIEADEKSTWYECNPALGLRLSEEFTQEEYKTLSADGFARERLGWWAKPITMESVMAINSEAWARCKSSDPKPEGKTAFGVKFSPDGSEVSLAGAVIPKDGPARITLLAVENTGCGLKWLADFLNARYKQASCVVIDGRNGSEVLVDKIRPVWVFKQSVIRPNAQDIVTSASLLVNDVNEGNVTWFEAQDELNESALTATRRNVGSGWAFGGQGCGPIEACSLALWGCRHSKRDPSKKQRISY